MTTIAYKDGVMAADEQNSWHSATVNKLWRLKDGSVIGFAGARDQGLEALAWIKNTDLPKPTVDDLHILRAYPDGRLSVYKERLVEVFLEEDVFAIGSGSEYAMGAMAAGGRAIDAVKIAAMFDPSTGDGVRTLVVHEN